VTISSKIQRKYLFPVIFGVLVLDSIIIMSNQLYGQPSEPIRSDVAVNTIPVGQSMGPNPDAIAVSPNTGKVL
jgi:hypothetical protein